MEHEAVSIVGIITEEVGSPRNDGTAGSALYSVPIRLSRSLRSDEARVFEQLWDRPPQWTTMHRPGIGRASGDRFILNGTTVEEVGQYHAATLSGVVRAFNETMTEVRRREAEAEQRAAEQEAAHRAQVAEAAKEIRFD